MNEKERGVVTVIEVVLVAVIVVGGGFEYWEFKSAELSGTGMVFLRFLRGFWG